jgi:hypothetical protein
MGFYCITNGEKLLLGTGTSLLILILLAFIFFAGLGSLQ